MANNKKSPFSGPVVTLRNGAAFIAPGSITSKELASSLTGSDTAGIQADNIANNAIQTRHITNYSIANSKLARMNEGLLKGRPANSGYGPVVDLTAIQLRTILNLQAQDIGFDDSSTTVSGNDVQAVIESIDEAIAGLGGGGGAVTSVAGRDGDVVLAADDISFDDTNTGLTGSDVQNIISLLGELTSIKNGTLVDNITQAITSNGSTVTITIEKVGGGDVRAKFSDGIHVIDCTPAATATLTAGTDSVPVLNYVYILASNDTLTATTVGWPSAEHVRIGTYVLQSAASVQTYGVYNEHRWTDHLASDYTGHLEHINGWIRSQNATWVSGVAPSFSGDGTGTIGVATTSGIVKQLHNQAFPAFSDPADIYVVNDPDTPYRRITSLTELLKDSEGVILRNRAYALVLWGSAHESGSGKLFLNLPSGSYSNSKYAEARQDLEGYTNYSIPLEFKGTGFPIYRIILDNHTDTTWDLELNGQGDDLRGQVPGVSAGSSSALATTFPDESFQLYDTVDNTKLLNFELDQITTGTARNITMADEDVDLGAITNSQLAQMATLTIKGNVTGGSADPQDLTASQVQTIINTDDGWIDTAQIENLAITVEKIDNGSISTAKFEPLAVTTAVIDNAAVTAAKLDLTMAPTWTGVHTFSANLNADADLIVGIDLDVGNDITVAGNVDGRDVSVDGAKLDGIEAGANATSATNIANNIRWFDDDFVKSNTPIYHDSTAITGGTIVTNVASGFGSLGLIGVATLRSTVSANTGRRLYTTSNAFEAMADLRSRITFMIPTTTSEKTIYLGFFQSGGTGEPDEGCWFQITDGTCQVKAGNNNTAQNNGSSETLSADTWYVAYTYWTSASSVHCVIEELDGTGVLDVTATTNLPTGTVQFFHGVTAFANANSGMAILNLLHVDNLGYGIGAE